MSGNAKARVFGRGRGRHRVDPGGGTGVCVWGGRMGLKKKELVTTHFSATGSFKSVAFFNDVSSVTLSDFEASTPSSSKT